MDVFLTVADVDVVEPVTSSLSYFFVEGAVCVEVEHVFWGEVAEGGVKTADQILRSWLEVEQFIFIDFSYLCTNFMVEWQKQMIILLVRSNIRVGIKP